MTGADLSVGDEVEVDIGPIAHGGHCVARHEGRVLFVRHTLPGERVVARVTEGGGTDRFLRADAVRVLTASPDRVATRCRYAGPGECGGCDFQHVDLAAQRDLKAAVVREQFQRVARVALPDDFAVEPVPGDHEGLGWRTRVEFALDDSGRPGLHRHRSHDTVTVDSCAIAAPAINTLLAAGERWPDHEAVDVVAAGSGPAIAVPVPDAAPVPYVTETVSTSGFAADFEVSARGFWQVHPGAAGAFTRAVLDLAQPTAGERALDLYAGVGLFAAVLADGVGASGQVVAVESHPIAALSAEANLAAYPNAVVIAARVDDAFGVPRPTPRGPRRGGRSGGRRPGARHPLLPPTADVVVLDPPRTGAGREVLRAVTGMRPRSVVYVACDPAALARDTAYLAESGWRLQQIRAFDAFPMTHHIECVAHFTPSA